MSRASVAVVARATEEAVAAWECPGLVVLVQVEHTDRRDLFPVTAALGLRDPRPDADELTVLQTIARDLDTMLVSDVPGDGQDTWRLVRPDGSSSPVQADDDDTFVLSPADRVALERDISLTAH